MDSRKEIESGCEPLQVHCLYRRGMRTRLTTWVRIPWSAKASLLIAASNDTVGNRAICHSLRCSGRSIRWTPQQ